MLLRGPILVRTDEPVRRRGDSASPLACIVRVLTADFPFISLWIRYYLLALAYQTLFAACGLLCTGAYSLLQRRSVLLPGRGANRARRPCFSLFFLTIFSGFEVYFMSFLLQIEDAMLMFDKQTNRHRGKYLFITLIIRPTWPFQHFW